MSHAAPVSQEGMYSAGFWELVADGQEAPYIEGGGEYNR